MLEVKRGDIFMADLEPVRGSEQGGERPVLVIQNDKGNQHSPTVVVIAITGKTHKKPWLPTHIRLHCKALPERSMALLEQIRTVDKSRFQYYIGHLEQEDMKAVEAALATNLDIRLLVEKN